MKLIAPTESQLLKIMQWFTNEQELTIWSGPNFRYPFDLASFTEDLRMDSLNSFVLVNDELDVIAFGQYYLRIGRCHLGRLVVNPIHRGQGIAPQLIAKLLKLGQHNLTVNEGSLFVLNHNEAAIKSYQSFGFVFTPYPETIPLDNCSYMTKVL